MTISSLTERKYLLIPIMVLYLHFTATSQEALKNFVSTSTFYYPDISSSHTDLSYPSYDASPPPDVDEAKGYLVKVSRNNQITKSLPLDKRRKSQESNALTIEASNESRIEERRVTPRPKLGTFVSHPNDIHRNSISLEELPTMTKESRSLSKAFKRIKTNGKRHVKDIFAPNAKSSLLLYGVAVDQENLSTNV